MLMACPVTNEAASEQSHTTPWLYLMYERIVFRKNYNYLREMETIVAHDY
jgi:hypothetical protein